MERTGKGQYALRNVGTNTATSVKVQLPQQYRNLVHMNPKDGPVGAGASVSVAIVSVAGLPTLRELPLSWDGQDRPVLVPIPIAE